MIDLLLFPFGGNAREALITALAQNKQNPTWNVLGFIDDNCSVWGKECCKIKVLGDKKYFNIYHKAKVIAVPGRPDNYWLRKDIIQSLGVMPDRFKMLIHPSVDIAEDARIGVNSVIMSGCVVSTGVVIGNHCVVLPNTVISHDTNIGDYTLIGSNVSISGGVSIGDSCYIGTGTSIIEEIKMLSY